MRLGDPLQNHLYARLSMYGQDVRGILTATLEIPHKISYPYIEREYFMLSWTFWSYKIEIRVSAFETPSFSQLVRPIPR